MEIDGLAPIAITKTRRPRDPRPLIERRRLDTLLEQPRALTVVWAPAGSGKTTALAGWLSRTGRPHAWVTLDGHDDRPGRFWPLLVEALGRLDPVAVARSGAVVADPGFDVDRQLLPLLVNELAESTEPIVVVLDDFHTIEQPELIGQIDRFVQLLAGQHRVVVSTRVAPTLAQAALRMRGDLLEVSVDDLRATDVEAMALVEARSPSLPDGIAASIVAGASGWIAGLQLSILAVEGTEGGAGRRRPGRAPAIDVEGPLAVDYLIEEVLGGPRSDGRRGPGRDLDPRRVLRAVGRRDPRRFRERPPARRAVPA